MQIIDRNTLSRMPGNLLTSAIISSVIVLPFAILELVNRRDFNEGFPVALFVFMWVLPLLFVLVLMPIVRGLWAGNTSMTNPVSLLLRGGILIVIAWFWFSLVLDQMPCFLGVPNCD